MSLRAKVIVLVSIEFLVIAMGLFIPAGTITWAAGWVFLGLIFGSGLPMTWWLLKYDPDLVQERMRSSRITLGQGVHRRDDFLYSILAHTDAA